MPSSIPSPPNRGFSLIELAIILVIVGIILSIGTASWVTFMEGRRVAKTRSVLQQAKDCLVRRVVFNERYPRAVDFEECVGEVGKDGWNRNVGWLIGFNDDEDALNGTMFVARDDARNQTATYPDTESRAVTETGDQKSVALILLSAGDDGDWDHSSYKTELNGAGPYVLNSSNPPDFVASQKDDIFLVVKGYEFTAAIKNAVGH
jgi:prepilin-type N-terminal cleavage/methylation domain-containing protein